MNRPFPIERISHHSCCRVMLGGLVLRALQLPERRPIAQFNCDQSLHNAFKLIEVPLALGVTGDREASVRAVHDTLADPVR